MRLSLWLSVDLYLTKQLHVTWNTGFFAFLYVDIHTTREPRLGKGSILFRKTNNNSNNKETLNSGIVLRIGLEFSRSRDSDSPTNLSMAKPVADRHAACILIITIKGGRLLTTKFPVRTFTLLPLIFHPGSSLLSSILMSLLLLDTNIPASGVSSLFPLSSSSRNIFCLNNV